MYLYSIMPLDTDHVEEICEDIKNQYESGVATCPLFSMTLVPEGNPPVPKAEILCEKYEIFRKRLCEMGIPNGVLVQATIGHGYALNNMFPFQKYVGLEGGEEKAICCPSDKDFQAHMAHVMEVIAAHHPDMIMVDDDFRLMFRPGRGCACPLHLAEFNRRAGTSFTREELWEALSRDAEGVEEYRRIFIATQEDSLIEAARAYRTGIDRVDPKIPGSFCCCTSVEAAAEIAETLAGEGNPVLLRINNGNYTPAGARYISVPMSRAAAQVGWLRGRVDAILAETDTCPQNRYSTSAQSLHSHFVASIMEGMNGAKHWITRLGANEPDSGKAYRRVLAKHCGMYEALSRIAPTLTPLGCRIPMPPRPLRVFRPEESPWTMPSIDWAKCVLEHLGLPFYFSSAEGGATFLEGEQDAYYSDEELQKLLCGTVFVAAKTAERIVSRGFGEYLGVTVRPWQGRNASGELLHVNGNQCNRQMGLLELVPEKDGVRADSTVFHIPDGKTKEPLFPGVTVYHNPYGGTAVVFSGTPTAEFHYGQAFSFLNESRKKQLARLLGETGHLPVYYTEDAEIALRAGMMKDGSLLCVLYNIGFDPLDDIPLGGGFPIRRVEQMQNDGSFREIAFSAEDTCVRVKTPLYTLEPVVLKLS